MSARSLLGLHIHLVGSHITVDAHCMLCSIFVTVSSMIVAQSKAVAAQGELSNYSMYENPTSCGLL